jgi:hypothetical protein
MSNDQVQISNESKVQISKITPHPPLPLKGRGLGRGWRHFIYNVSFITFVLVLKFDIDLTFGF